MTDKKADSVVALKQYLVKDEKHTKRHNANILIYPNRKEYGVGTRVIYVNLDDNFGQVIIENLESI